MKYLSYILLISCVFIINCSNKKEHFSISGKIDKGELEYVSLYQQTAEGAVQIDSAKIEDDNSFILKGETPSPAFFVLKNNFDEYINLIIHPRDKIEIVINGENYEVDYYLNGSNDSKLLQENIIAQKRVLRHISELSYEYEKSKEDPGSFIFEKARIDKIYDSIVNEHKEFIIKTIKNNPHSFTDIWALYQNLGPRTSLFDRFDDYEIFNFVDSNLSLLYPHSEAVKLLNQEVVELSEIIKYKRMEEGKVKLGEIAPNIILPDSSNSLVELSSFKGKYVLLAFWASWNNVSCEMNKEYTEIYKKYKRKGFEIYQVSLDMSRESWVRTIKKDELSWANVSDLKYWNSAVVPIYQVYQIPTNYFLDKEGKIIEKNITGNNLETKLGELLK